MEENVDKRYLKSQASIEQAMETLYKSGKTFSTITISEITNLAHISRKTFYLHYVDLNDFIIQTINNGIKEVTSILFESPSTPFGEAIANCFLALTKRLQDSYMAKMLINDEKYAAFIFDKLKLAIKEFLNFNDNAPCLDNLEQEFCAAGALFSYKFWVKSHKEQNYDYCKEHISDFSKRITNILQNRALDY